MTAAPISDLERIRALAALAETAATAAHSAPTEASEAIHIEHFDDLCTALLDLICDPDGVALLTRIEGQLAETPEAR